MDILIHSISLTGIRGLREELLTKLHEFIPHKSFEYYDNKMIRICHHGTKTIRIRFVYGVFLDGVKVLGNGTLTKKLTVVANKFSKTAEEKIQAVGGKTEVK